MKFPDTDIPCETCKGTKKSKWNHECGACFGSGLSTLQHHQKRNGTTVTKSVEELKHMERTGYKIETSKYCERSRKFICLVSWANPDYESYLNQIKEQVK